MSTSDSTINDLPEEIIEPGDADNLVLVDNTTPNISTNNQTKRLTYANLKTTLQKVLKIPVDKSPANGTGVVPSV